MTAPSAYSTMHGAEVLEYVRDRAIKEACRIGSLEDSLISIGMSASFDPDRLAIMHVLNGIADLCTRAISETHDAKVHDRTVPQWPRVLADTFRASLVGAELAADKLAAIDPEDDEEAA